MLAALAALATLVPALQAQVNVPESLALPLSAVDKSKPGFTVRVLQATSQFGELPNTTTRMEAQLAGLLLQPDGTPYANVADLSSFNPDGTYTEPGIISYGGNFFPGIPGTEGNINNIALEAITYAELQPGTYTMVVNSDDGFRVTIGDARDRLREVKIGEYDGGRGASDTVFSFTITQAGVYPLRLAYEQGGGGYSVDWFTAPNGAPENRVHLNADGGLKTYRALTAATPLGPAVTGVQPLPGSINQPPSAGFTALIQDGSTPLNQASLRLLRNGTDVTSGATIGRQGNVTRVSYKPAVLPDPLSKETYRLVFDDATAAGGKREADCSFTLAAYANFVLPEPIWKETFDTIQEGTLPQGWTTFSPYDTAGFEDLNDPGSDSYLTWVVISRQRVADLSTRWDANRRLNTPEAYINGTRVQSLIINNFAYHESDIRSGSQYAELISPTINLTGRTDVNLVFHSIYEQNQDNIAGVEYSVDNGTTWLPVVYMIDVPDIVTKADGSADGEATLTKVNGDTAVDPSGVEERTFGAFVKADRSTWANIGPYISGRINDDAQESKRIEKFRLPQADNKAQVKLRFFQAGTGSWYFGVDEVGLYSITTFDPPSLTTQPKDATVLAGAPVWFSATASGQQLSYQWQKDGVNIPGATSATLNLARTTKADAGKYRAVISNPGGSVNSAEATLAVQDVPQAGTLKNGLIAYLPFDTDLTDKSGNNRNGSAVGSPQITTGLLGAGAVRVTNTGENRNFVTLGKNADLPVGETKDFSVAFWMKTERVNSDPSIVGTKDWDSGNNPGWLIGTQGDGRLEWNYRRQGEGTSRKDLDAAGQNLAASVWQHVLVVFNINGDAVSYVNGLQIDARSIAPGTGALSNPDLSLNIGQDGTGTYGSEWDGLIDDLAIWDRALTATEAAALAGQGFAGVALDGSGGSPTQPTLAVSRGNNQLTLTWEGSGFTLEESAALGAGAAWTAVGGAGANSATVPTTAAAKFYRLRK